MPVYHLHVEVEFDFQLVGLTCHEREHRIAWSLNKSLGWSLERQDDLFPNHDGLGFPMFCFENEDSQYSLFSNKTGFDCLIPELQHYDYLLKIENQQEEIEDDFFRALRSVPMVIAAFPVLIEKLKSKQNLIWT